MKNKRYIFPLISLLFLAACSPKTKQAEPASETTAKTATGDIDLDKKLNAEAGLPSIIEIVFSSDTVSPDGLMELCGKYNIDRKSVYKWRNHVIIYDVSGPDKSAEMETDIARTYPDEQINRIKYYDIPYYIFDRKNCEKRETASEWSHTIMTANIVADSTMQQEYMNYHATQAEQWPEIANGFCKADFQQLLMFCNGRQLMLIISIPKGENLDDLNPRTTENNPRVDEWNAVMAKYQEGIEDADKGDVWVTFEQLTIN
ncbi:MAG: L-rhamnose mutarotase [Tannerella sp.]|jgi:L-rhamnose mutarotase|nr:L-rhamnose mutarotase [Tannerella sp.]